MPGVIAMLRPPTATHSSLVLVRAPAPGSRPPTIASTQPLTVSPPSRIADKLARHAKTDAIAAKARVTAEASCVSRSADQSANHRKPQPGLALGPVPLHGRVAGVRVRLRDRPVDVLALHQQHEPMTLAHR